MDDTPLWTKETIDMVAPILNRDSLVLEIGSGASTIWFAKRVNLVVSLENDEGWYQQVRRECVNQSIKNVNINLRDIVKPDYMQFILDQPDEFYDFILIDGAFRRVEAFEKCLAKLKPMGMIMLDDSQNPSWKGIFTLKSVNILIESVPDSSGKQATIFVRT